MTDEDLAWLVEWAYRTVSLSFLWHGKFGYQFIFMPIEPYPWCIPDDEAPQLHNARESWGGGYGAGSRSH